MIWNLIDGLVTKGLGTLGAFILTMGKVKEWSETDVTRGHESWLTIVEGQGLNVIITEEQLRHPPKALDSLFLFFF